MSVSCLLELSLVCPCVQYSFPETSFPRGSVWRLCAIKIAIELQLDSVSLVDISSHQYVPSFFCSPFFRSSSRDGILPFSLKIYLLIGMKWYTQFFFFSNPLVFIVFNNFLWKLWGFYETKSYIVKHFLTIKRKVLNHSTFRIFIFVFFLIRVNLCEL